MAGQPSQTPSEGDQEPKPDTYTIPINDDTEQALHQTAPTTAHQVAAQVATQETNSEPTQAPAPASDAAADEGRILVNGNAGDDVHMTGTDTQPDMNIEPALETIAGIGSTTVDGIQAEAASVQIEAASVQIEAASVQVEAASVQVEAASVQVEAANVDTETLTITTESIAANMASQPAHGESALSTQVEANKDNAQAVTATAEPVTDNIAPQPAKPEAPSSPRITSALEAALDSMLADDTDNAASGNGTNPEPMDSTANPMPTDNSNVPSDDTADAEEEHPEWEVDSSPYETDSSDSSDSSDEEEDNEPYSLLSIEETARFLMGGDDPQRDAEAAARGLRSRNERPEKAPPLPDVVITEDMKLELIGPIQSIVEDTIVINSTRPNEQKVLDSGTVLCKEDRTVVGSVRDVIGNVNSPLYTALFSSRAQIKELGLAVDTPLYYSVDHANFVFTQPLRQAKHTDASNMYDEEVNEDEAEFSDDEKEALYKQERRNMRRAKQGLPPVGSRQSKGRPPAPNHQARASERNGDDDDGPYRPLTRPSSMGHGPSTLPPRPDVALPSGPDQSPMMMSGIYGEGGRENSSAHGNRSGWNSHHRGVNRGISHQDSRRIGAYDRPTSSNRSPGDPGLSNQWRQPRARQHYNHHNVHRSAGQFNFPHNAVHSYSSHNQTGQTQTAPVPSPYSIPPYPPPYPPAPVSGWPHTTQPQPPVAAPPQFGLPYFGGYPGSGPPPVPSTNVHYAMQGGHTYPASGYQTPQAGQSNQQQQPSGYQGRQA